MRLSPPISVLTIVAGAFVWMSVYQGPLGCSVDSDWEIGPSLPASLSHCDPWVGIMPSMPISQISVDSEVSSWVLLVRPDGTGYLAVRKPVGNSWRDNLVGDEWPQSLPTNMELLRNRFVIHDFKDPHIYKELYIQLSPMRDFLGDPSIMKLAQERHMRSSPRRSYGCEARHFSADPIWIEWGVDFDSPDSVSLINLSCKTRATNAAGRRIRRAVEEVARVANVPSASLLKQAGLEGF